MAPKPYLLQDDQHRIDFEPYHITETPDYSMRQCMIPMKELPAANDLAQTNSTSEQALQERSNVYGCTFKSIDLNDLNQR